jgi:uncharacterized protein with HEPN domain
MQPETRKYLYDVLKACEAILEFVKGKSFEDYAIVENATVWGILQADLPRLYEQVKVLLDRP